MTTPAPPEESRFAAGHRIAGRYTISAVAGEGATGTVYLATVDGGPRQVALKVIHRHLCGDRQIYQRFHREAAILKRIEGEHVVKLLDFIEEDGLLVIAIEHVEGGSLEALLRREAPLGVERAVDVALQICAALESAHGAGVVHRDLKPANVVLEAGSGKVRVVDFGLAKVVHGEQMTTGLTEQDMIFGTPEYMAPEQARGDDVDARCDIYALGCMLYEMTIGTVPFKKRTPIATMTAQLTEEPPHPRSSKRDGSISSSLEAVILRALAKRPEDRYESARAFAEALLACRDQARVVALPGAQGIDAVSITAMNEEHLLGHSPTVPSDPPGPPSARAIKELALAATLPVDAPPPPIAPARIPVTVASSPPPRPASRRTSRWSEGWIWVVVAVVFAALGVAIGTLVGSR